MENPVSELSEKSKWIHGLDSLRIVLAIIVMLGHMPGTILNALKQNHFTFISVMFCGPAAVIAFFILSGFVIHFPNRNKKTFDVKSYLIRRILRISLPLIVVVIVGSYFNLANTIPIWSLYCELIYYILYPLIFRVKLSWQTKFIISFIIAYAIIISLNFGSLLSFVHQRDINFKREYWELNNTFLTAIIGLPSWLLGVNIADKLDSYNRKVSFRNLILYRLAVYIVSSALLVAAFHLHLSYMLSLNIFALLAVVWIKKEIIYYRSNKYSQVLEYMGRFSYTLYLWHRIIFAGVSLLLSGLVINVVPAYLAYPVLAMIFSYILYILVEYPSHKAAVALSKLVKK
jgi:peptidoglycan/LPS O-acetylase OafA/YrhL